MLFLYWRFCVCDSTKLVVVCVAEVAPFRLLVPSRSVALFVSSSGLVVLSETIITEKFLGLSLDWSFSFASLLVVGLDEIFCDDDVKRWYVVVVVVRRCHRGLDRLFSPSDSPLQVISGCRPRGVWTFSPLPLALAESSIKPP